MASISRAAPKLLIALAVFAAYGNALTGPFLFDDHVSIVRNMSIRRVLPLAKSLSGPQDSPTAGRPVANLSFALNYRAGRLDVVGYHVANVLIHVLNAFLLFALIRLTLVSSQWGEYWRKLATWVALATALLWALHPLQTETVTYVTQRTELLMAMFLLATVYSARRIWDAQSPQASVLWHAVCLVSCALGMASKEVMVVAPILVVLYDVAVIKLPASEIIPRRKHLYWMLAATWGILAWLLASNPRSQSVGVGFSIRPVEYLTTQFWAISHYLWLALWPARLCGDYGMLKITEVGEWLPGFVLVVLLIGLSIFAWFRCRPLSFLGIWFFFILAPTTSILPIASEPIAERRMYLPLAAILILAVVGSIEFSRRWNTFFSRALIAAIGLSLALIYAGTTFCRNQVFRSELAFWEDVTQKRPTNSRGFNSLGLAYLEGRNQERAMVAYQRAIEIDPSNADAQMNLGNLYQIQKRYEESRRHLELALQANPSHVYAMINLGNWYSYQGNIGEALQCLDAALAINPQLVEPHQVRGRILHDQGRFEEAIRDYEVVVQLNPDSSGTYNSLGTVYLAKNQFDTATQNFQIALQLDPKSSSACTNLGTVLARQGNYREAAGWFEQAIRLEPSLIDAMYNLGNCYALLDRTQEAIALYQKILAAQPNDVSAWFALGKTYAKSGQQDKARECFDHVLQLRPGAIEALQEIEKLGGR